MKNIFFILSVALFVGVVFSEKYNFIEKLLKNKQEFDEAVEKYDKDLNNIYMEAIDMLENKYNNYIRNLLFSLRTEVTFIEGTVVLSMAGPNTRDKCNKTARSIDINVFNSTKIEIDKCLKYYKELLEYNLSPARLVGSSFISIDWQLQWCIRNTKHTWAECFDIKFPDRKNQIIEAVNFLNNSTKMIHSLDKQFNECSMNHYVLFTEKITTNARDLQNCVDPPQDLTLLKKFRQ